MVDDIGTDGNGSPDSVHVNRARRIGSNCQIWTYREVGELNLF
jgi:hypothetical protein